MMREGKTRPCMISEAWASWGAPFATQGRAVLRPYTDAIFAIYEDR